MDGVTLDATLAELCARLLGRHVGRVRLLGRHAVTLEVSRERLWLDTSTGSAGVYWLSAPLARTLEPLITDEASGAARQFLLHARKHVAGTRTVSLRRVAGHRVVVLELGAATLVLRLRGTAALTLVVAGEALATLGDGAAAWPLPPDDLGSEWHGRTPDNVARTVRDAAGEGRDPVRALVAACPTLTRRLLEDVAVDPALWPAVRAKLAAPRPFVLLPRPLAENHEADLAASPAAVVPFVPAGFVGHAHTADSWIAAGAVALEAVVRGRAFAAARRDVLTAATTERQRAWRLVQNLRKDAAGLPDPVELRLRAEALLAFSRELPPGASEVEVPDPRGEGTLRLTVDPRLSGPANADRWFARARRIDQARSAVEARRVEAERALEAATEREERATRAASSADLHTGDPPEKTPARVEAKAAGPRRYLTSRGVMLLVGRGARENHELTFAIASPEDLWLHARDVPGAHVILRDREHRAGAQDIREAAETAAFFSDAAGQAAVDVHVTRRKHVRPGRGSAGKVLIGHSDTVRAVPRDPEGRLRRR